MAPILRVNSLYFDSPLSIGFDEAGLLFIPDAVQNQRDKT